MATVKSVGDKATEIRIDSLNAVLFHKDRPIAAVVGGKGYTSAVERSIADWMLEKVDPVIEMSFKPQSFFDNILKIYMNPAAFDTPRDG